MERIDVAVVGGGQAGLAMSACLAGRGIEHVVLERGRIGQSWRDRWDSFCLVTPNWSVQLPGRPYDGDDPDGYMPRDDIAATLVRYVDALALPVREGVAVDRVERDDEGFALATSEGSLRARVLVLATGAYQRPFRPPGADELPSDVLQLDVTGYRNPDALPAGPVLVVGSGQSGCQLAEELHRSGREVVLACGKAPWAPRRFAGHDIAWWALESGFMDQTLDQIPMPPREARLTANFQASGHDGGHDLHLRTLDAMGITLAGRFLGSNGRVARFAPDLPATIAWGDTRYLQFLQLCATTAAARGQDPVPVEPPPTLTPTAPESVDLTGFGAVIFAGGFRPEYGSLAPWPDAFDADGFPLQHDGASDVVDDLYFVGVHFLRTRRSSLLFGVGIDAEVVASTIAARS